MNPLQTVIALPAWRILVKATIWHPWQRCEISLAPFSKLDEAIAETQKLRKSDRYYAVKIRPI